MSAGTFLEFLPELVLGGAWRRFMQLVAHRAVVKVLTSNSPQKASIMDYTGRPPGKPGDQKAGAVQAAPLI